MCGIAGIFNFEPRRDQRELFAAATRTMTSLQTRRGPDDEGFWSDPEGHLEFGFRRLAILDLTPAGNQPMVSRDGRSVLIFNGEIYNFRELRKELEAVGYSFRSSGDAEVLLYALEHWDKKALERLDGMFAFAWYRPDERRLLLARDAAGVKPMYVFVHPQRRGVAFASQFDALLHTPWGEPGSVREDVLHLYLRLHHIPAPFALLENTYQLEPGHSLSITSDGGMRDETWWRMPRDPEPDLTGTAAVDAVGEAIAGSVARQRVADVPVGVFLSGGVDSPLVTATARTQTGSGLKAFTIGNPGWRQDESEEARALARHLDVDHRIEEIGGDIALSLVEDVIEAQHEPFADFSILPTMLVSRIARRDVTVSLSGDGGDELFFGYERPLSLMRNGRDFRWPWAVRLGLYGAGRYGFGPKRSDVIVARTPGHYYFEVNSRLDETQLGSIAPGLAPLPSELSLYSYEGWKGERDLANFARWAEFNGQLQRCLKKVDMGSMHESLEVRVPLLGSAVMETSLRIDPLDSIRSGERKAVLRRLLERHVPKSMMQAPKRGFAVPLGDWLRGSLRPLVEDTLFSGPLYPDGIFDRDGIRALWDDHLSGRADRKWALWTLLSLQWWAASHLRSRATADA